MWHQQGKEPVANCLACLKFMMAALDVLKDQPRRQLDFIALLPGDPKYLFENGQFNRVPLMIGNTNAEGLLVADVVLGKDFSSTELKGLLENPIVSVGTADTNRTSSQYHVYKNVSCLWNRRPLKLLNDTKLILGLEYV